MTNTVINEKRNDKFYEMLDFLKDELFNLSKMDKSSDVYKILSETKLAYSYIELVMHCKMYNDIEIAEFLGRPSFLLSENQLVEKLKRKNPIKSVPLYLKRIEYLVHMGFIRKIPFIEIDSRIINMINESLFKEKPDLYIMVDVTSSMMSKIPDWNIDFASINQISIQQKEREEKLLEIQREKLEKRRSKAIKVTEKKKEKLVKISKKTSGKSVKLTEPAIKKTNKFMELKMKQEKGILSKKLREYTTFNMGIVKSSSFSQTYKKIDDYLNRHNLKELYCEILNFNNNMFKIHQFEYKNKPVFFIDQKMVASIYRDIYQKSITHRDAGELFEKFSEIGMFKKLPVESLAQELGIGKKNLVTIMHENSYMSFTTNKDLYILMRLNESQLVRISNKISVMKLASEDSNNTGEVVKKQKEKIESKKPIEYTNVRNSQKFSEDVDSSIMECAIDILIESKIEGNKVTIDKTRFDRLIKSILGEDLAF